MRLRKWRIADLNAAKYNPRVDLRPGDPVYDKLKKSIETFGFVQPIIVNRRNKRVIGGHQRLKILKDLGYDEVDVVLVDLPIAKEKALNVTLNKTVGDWDETKLASLLQEFDGLPDFDIELTGFDSDEVGDLISRVLDRDTESGDEDAFDVEAALDESRPAITRYGELLELGVHRLLCGDSTKASPRPMVIECHVMTPRRAVWGASTPRARFRTPACRHEAVAARDRWTMARMTSFGLCAGYSARPGSGAGRLSRLDRLELTRLCKLADASKDTLNKLSADAAGRGLGETLPQGTKPLHALATGETVRAIHGASYTRLYNADLLRMVREFATDFVPPQATGIDGNRSSVVDDDIPFVPDSAPTPATARRPMREHPHSWPSRSEACFLRRTVAGKRLKRPRTTGPLLLT